MSEDDKARALSGDHHHHHHPPPPQQYPPPQYGTFQGVSGYPPESQQPPIGFPQPVPPPGALDPYYARGYQAIPPGILSYFVDFDSFDYWCFVISIPEFQIENSFNEMV